MHAKNITPLIYVYILFSLKAAFFYGQKSINDVIGRYL